MSSVARRRDEMKKSSAAHPKANSRPEAAAAAAYLAPPRVEFQRGQVGVKDHVAGLDVDGRLPLADGAQVPGGVHQTPEGRDCGGWKKGTVISERAYSSGAPRDQTARRGSESHYEGEKKKIGEFGEILIYIRLHWNLT